MLIDNDFSICCLQETEIPQGFPQGILNCNDYTIEHEMNEEKIRTGIYIKKGINYTRRTDLELPNLHVVIIDCMTDVNFRVISLYRSFHPPGHCPRWSLGRFILY